jgi:fructokinase
MKRKRRTNMLIGGIEAGGTKMVCGVGTWEKDHVSIVDSCQFPTVESEIVIPQMISYFKKWPVEALGIASFGPIDLHKESPTYGYVKLTPKKGWGDTDFTGPFQHAFQIPVGFDTDVNGAALGEWFCGAAKGLESAVYMTVGTGIGIGFIMNGMPLHGLLHPEGGHMFIRRAKNDSYEGCCPFHKDEHHQDVCLEGLACGPAIEGRWGAPGEALADKQEVWDLEAYYLAQGIANTIYFYSPQKIIIGGGVMHQTGLYSAVRERTKALLNGYIQSPLLDTDMDQYIVPPALGQFAGLIGAIVLGKRALDKEK